MCRRVGARPTSYALPRRSSYWSQLASCAVLLCSAHSIAGQEQQPLTTVVVSRVIEAKVKAGRRVVGTVNPLRSSTIGSAVDGRVIEFLIDQGDPVKEGQPLAQLRTETLEIELAAAQSELNLYEQQLAELENGSRPEDVDEARARMLGAKAAMKYAASKLERMKLLVASRAASETDVDDARERAEFSRHTFAATEALLKRIEEGPRIEKISQAKAQVELQRQRVRLIEDRIKRHTIVAPFDGFVATEFTEVGAWITSGDPVAQIVQLDEVEIQAPATAEYAVQLRRGDTIRVEFPELPDQLFTGSVERVVPVAESRARTFPVHIRMKNEVRDGGPLLMAGMLARVELPTGQRENAPMVTKDALVLNETERTVFVVDLDVSSTEGDGVQSSAKRFGVVRKISVELGVAAGGLIQIRGPVRPGDFVVAVGNERLRDGERVEIIRVAENDQSAVELGPRSASAK